MSPSVLGQMRSVAESDLTATAESRGRACHLVEQFAIAHELAPPLQVGQGLTQRHLQRSWLHTSAARHKSDQGDRLHAGEGTIACRQAHILLQCHVGAHKVLHERKEVGKRQVRPLHGLRQAVAAASWQPAAPLGQHYAQK